MRTALSLLVQLMIWSIIGFLVISTVRGFREARREGRITSYRPFVWGGLMLLTVAGVLAAMLIANDGR